MMLHTESRSRGADDLHEPDGGHEVGEAEPIADLQNTPLSDADAELFESLPPELARKLFPERAGGPMQLTLEYPELDASQARELEASGTAHEVDEPEVEGQPPTHRTTFSLHQIEEFHQLYHLAERAFGAARVKVLIDDHSLPMTRELWLPLMWTLRR